MLDISVVILTLNEELHIKRCLERICPIVKKVYLIDCNSTDNTVSIAKQHGAEVIPHAWPGNHATQLNWALDNIEFNTEWILRLDADEYLTDELILELRERLPSLKEDISALVLPLKRVFMGREIRYGTSDVSMIRIFRRGKIRCEQRWMDEHMIIEEGKTITLNHKFVDDNLNTISFFTLKHDKYSIREAIVELNTKHNILNNQTPQNNRLCNEVTSKRNQKTLYSSMPLFLRAFVYFILRYIIRGGFLDGKEGFLWHFLQGWWYRTLVDAKLFEITKACGSDTNKIKAYLKDKYQIEL